jgi:hypothetical protein
MGWEWRECLRGIKRTSEALILIWFGNWLQRGVHIVKIHQAQHIWFVYLSAGISYFSKKLKKKKQRWVPYTEQISLEIKKKKKEILKNYVLGKASLVKNWSSCQELRPSVKPTTYKELRLPRSTGNWRADSPSSNLEMTSARDDRDCKWDSDQDHLDKPLLSPQPWENLWDNKCSVLKEKKRLHFCNTIFLPHTDVSKELYLQRH